MPGLLKFREFSRVLESFTYDEPINEGGAYGHLNHPFEDIGLTFLDLEEMLMTTVNGAFGPENFVQEKCLPYDSLVQTENHGEIPIGKVVEDRILDRVLSFNEVTGELEYAEILNWVKNGSSSEWLEIRLDDDSILIVTPNHRVFVSGKGDIKAENLSINDELITTVFS